MIYDLKGNHLVRNGLTFRFSLARALPVLQEDPEEGHVLTRGQMGSHLTLRRL